MGFQRVAGGSMKLRGVSGRLNRFQGYLKDLPGDSRDLKALYGVSGAIPEVSVEL